MHVDHLLRMDRLDLSLVWGDETLLGQEIAGVTATDLEDPARFLQRGEVVLSGLVWWTPEGGPGRTDRFVSALREAGAVALLAGEETHGEVPRQLVDACRKFRVALIAVPPQTSFRAVTEAVYLRQWGDLSGRPGDHHALPENVRRDLDHALEGGAEAGELLDRAFAHLGAPACHLLTSSGRTVARTGGAPRLPAPRAAEALRGGRGTTVRVESESTAFDTWYLHLPEGEQVPPRVLEEISGLLGRFRRRRDQHRAARDTAAARLVAAVGALRPDPDGLRGALEACDLAGMSSYTVVTAALEPGDDGTAALGEALAHLRSVTFAVARGAGDEATAVVAHTGDAAAGIGERLREIGPLIRDCRPQSAWRAGVSAPVATAAGLNTALMQARYALAAARSPAPDTRPVVVQGELGGLAVLLAGVPADVRKVYRETVLGPLVAAGPKSGPMLLETLQAFLDHDCSWARTAEALHVHVNTVHYRVQRIELLTGRDLSRLDNRLDLRTALLC
ncbi:transcriptional regulator, PucR family protein [Streptomyces sp. CB01249]|uniref:PucR family transcriptional regulator n=1 Tax=Streptomyces sp. CB01249 TaxID=1703929 RepID=UPI00093C7706|nr:PucR family transcriptional regulator [Streptomyces sp. CB01249]OKJ04565.1 transcriptional regulator, PucR family protein [Streptomyces sp. CB01249]